LTTAPQPFQFATASYLTCIRNQRAIALWLHFCIVRFDGLATRESQLDYFFSSALAERTASRNLRALAVMTSVLPSRRALLETSSPPAATAAAPARM